jgi:hypothetical protein
VRIFGIPLILALSPFALHAQSPAPDCSHRTAQDYVPVTRQDRMADYIRAMLYPQAFLYVGALAGINQATNRPREWGQGADGYGQRFSNEYARHAIATTLQDGIALGLGEDNRYYRSGRRGFPRRLEYALSSPFLARLPDGSRTISISALSGVAGGALLQETWQPASTSGIGYAGRSFGLTFALRMAVDVVREFAPRAVTDLLR